MPSMSQLQPGARIVVQKLDTRGVCTLTYDAVVAEVLPNGLRLDARWTRPALALGYTTFETGDHFTEWYFTDRWYNIFEIASPDGRRKGWYCNITEPAQIVDHTLSNRDLLLDLWVNPDYSMIVLDEDEFAEDTALTPETRAKALATLAELCAIVERHEPPFDDNL